METSPKWENEGKWIEDSEGRRRRRMRNKEESLEHTIWSFKEGGGGYFTSDLLGPRKSVIYLSDIIIYPNEK